MTTDGISVDFSVRSWESRSFETCELSRVQETGLSGLLKIGELWSLILAGRHAVTASRDDGDWTPVSLEEIDFTTQTAEFHESPADEHAALLACQMAPTGTEDTYYTEDKPIEQIDELLREQSFSGYLKMAENTMTGTHYISYIDGDQYVYTDANATDEPLTGQKAYTRLCSEVAIYAISESRLNTGTAYFEIADKKTQQQDVETATGAETERDAPSHSDAEGETTETASDTATAETDEPSDEEASGEPSDPSSTQTTQEQTRKTAETQSGIDAAHRLDNIEDAVTQLESTIEGFSTLLTDSQESSDTTPRSLAPSQALENTRLNIRPKIGETTNSDDAQTKIEQHPRHIVPVATLDTENTTVSDTSYEEFVQGTVEHRFVEWIFDVLHTHIRQNQTVNLPGIEQMVSQMRQIVLRETLDNTDTLYDAVMYGKNGEPTGIVTRMGSDSEGRLSDIRKTIREIQPIADDSDHIINVFVLSSSGFSPGICPQVEQLTEDKSLVKRENRDALVKSDDGGEIHICLLEQTKSEFFMVYPEQQIGTTSS